MLMSFTDERLLRAYRAIGPIQFLVALVAALTLEIYIIHEYLIYYPWLINIRFPLNIIVLVVHELWRLIAGGC